MGHRKEGKIQWPFAVDSDSRTTLPDRSRLWPRACHYRWLCRRSLTHTQALLSRQSIRTRSLCGGQPASPSPGRKRRGHIICQTCPAKGRTGFILSFRVSSTDLRRSNSAGTVPGPLFLRRARRDFHGPTYGTTVSTWWELLRRIWRGRRVWWFWRRRFWRIRWIWRREQRWWWEFERLVTQRIMKGSCENRGHRVGLRKPSVSACSLCVALETVANSAHL